MIKRNCGHICNIASAAGMISNPRMSIYAASKWAVIGWSDSVRIELSEMKSKVRITTSSDWARVCFLPGFSTGFSGNCSEFTIQWITLRGENSKRYEQYGRQHHRFHSRKAE